MHDIPFRPQEVAGGVQQVKDYETDPSLCQDSHPRCGEWAAAGECQRNRNYMAGENGGLGACRKSCRACEMCRTGDMECINRNRARSGYWPYNKEELEWWVRWRCGAGGSVEQGERVPGRGAQAGVCRRKLPVQLPSPLPRWVTFTCVCASLIAQLTFAVAGRLLASRFASVRV